MMPLFRKTSVEPRINIHIMFQHAYEQGEMEKMWSGGSAVAWICGLKVFNYKELDQLRCYGVYTPCQYAIKSPTI